MKTLLLALLVLPLVALADGTRGGGETIMIGKQKELRDKFEPTNCTWKSGAKVYNENPSIGKILDKLATVDWYWASDLRRELRTLNFCYTGKLYHVRTNDYDSVAIIVTTSTTQAGVRIQNKVYVDKNEVAQLNAVSQGLFYIHETMHSYIPWFADQRNQKVRSMVGAISELYDGVPTTTEDFRVQMANNEIQFPETSEHLDNVRLQVEFLNSDQQSKVAVLKQVSNFDGFIEGFGQIPSRDLTPSDQTKLSSFNFARYVERVCATGDTAALDLLSSGQITKVNVAAACLASDEVWKRQSIVNQLIASNGFLQLTHSSLSELALKTLSMGQYRLMSTGFVRMSQTVPEGDSQRFTELEALVGGFKNMDPSLKGYFNIIIMAINTHNLTLLDSLINNVEFNPAFDVKAAQTQIAQISNYYFPQEKQAALDKLENLTFEFWKAVITQMSQRGVSNVEINIFVKTINSKNFGYQIKGV